MFNTIRNRIARSKIFHRFVRHEKGATAVEFAMVGIPFMAMMFAIVETALVFFAGQVLETAAADSARKILTGQAETWDENKFKEEVCSHIFGLFDCNKIHMNVKAYSSFSSANMSRPVNASGEIVKAFEPGQPGDVVIARLMYEWPIQIPNVGLNLTDMPGNKRLLVATAAFRNEPYK